MTRSKPIQIQDLAEWLNIATKDLVPSAKERIRREIEIHYAEAVEQHLSMGASENAALTDALEELGDAQQAGKRFRKQHFTEAESRKLLAWFDRRYDSLWFWTESAILPLLAVLLHNHIPHIFGASPMVLLALFPGIGAIRFYLVRHCNKRDLKLFFLLTSLSYAHGLVLFSFIWGISLYAVLLSLTGFLLRIVFDFRFHLKLWRFRNFQAEMVSKTTAAA